MYRHHFIQRSVGGMTATEMGDVGGVKRSKSRPTKESARRRKNRRKRRREREAAKAREDVASPSAGRRTPELGSPPSASSAESAEDTDDVNRSSSWGIGAIFNRRRGARDSKESLIKDSDSSSSSESDGDKTAPARIQAQGLLDGDGSSGDSGTENDKKTVDRNPFESPISAGLILQYAGLAIAISGLVLLGLTFFYQRKTADNTVEIGDDTIQVIIVDDQTPGGGPTNNTVLASIDTEAKTSNTHLATIAGDTTSLDGKADTTNSHLATIAGDTTSLDGKADTANGHLATIAGDTTSLDGKVDTTNGHLATIAGDTTSMDTKADTRDGHLATIASDTTSLDTKADTRDGHLATVAGDTTSMDATLSALETLITQTNALITATNALVTQTNTLTTTTNDLLANETIAVDSNTIALTTGGSARDFGPRSPYGARVVAEPRTLFQAGFSTGINTQHWLVQTGGANITSSVADGELVLTADNAPGGSTSNYVAVSSRTALIYRPGQGSLLRFSARFHNDSTNTLQIAGLLNINSAFTIGVNAGQFGVQRYGTGGGPEIVTFTFTTPVANGATETLTFTLSGDFGGFFDASVTVTADASSTVEETAALVSDEADQFTYWNVQVAGDTITLSFRGAGARGDTYSMSSTGAAVATATIVTDGVANDVTWTYQDDFSLDPLDGTGYSGMDLDVRMGNTFEIGYQWGYGAITFSIVAPNGTAVPFHVIEHANNAQTVATTSPNMRAFFSLSTDYADEPDVKTMEVSSVSAFVFGPIIRQAPIFGLTQQTVYGTGAGTYPLFTLRVNQIVSGRVFHGSAFLKALTITMEDTTGGSDIWIVRMYRIFSSDYASSGGTWQPVDDSTPSLCVYSVDADVTSAALDAATLLLPLSGVNDGSTGLLDLAPFEIELTPGDAFFVQVEIEDDFDVSISVTWVEDAF